jgi:hypothetical protein
VEGRRRRPGVRSRLGESAHRALDGGAQVETGVDGEPVQEQSVTPKVASGFRHLPGFNWHRPGGSLRGVFSEAYVAHPTSEATIDAHVAPIRR